ncbi:unnamed protein product [Closterium sp. Naga37s-1]|nr:unnamed protein product [Closterium sp. Naga37s-1]
METAASCATLGVRRTSHAVANRRLLGPIAARHDSMRASSTVRASFLLSQAFSAVVALLAVAFTAHSAAASIVYRSAGVHASNGAARARELGQAEEDEAERVKQAAHAEMARALWEETEAQFEGRLQEWRRQSARLQGVAQRKREKRARRQWARAQGKAKLEHTQAAGVARVASPTDEELLDLMPGGTRSWQNLKASTARSSSPSPSAFSASIASSSDSSPSSSSNSSSSPSSSSSGSDNKNDTATPTPWEENRPAGESPCSPRSTGPVINVTTLDHILSRTQYPSNQTVTLVLQASITLNHSLELSKQADTLPSECVLEITTDTEPVLQVHNASNMLFIGIGLRSPVRNGSAYCESLPEYGNLLGNDLLCPALLIYRSYGIQFTQASVVGRIDVFRCAYTKLDSLFATAPWDFQYHPGVIRMGMSGIGVNLTSSENIISNNDLFGAWELIYLYRGTIGATVSNNFLHGYLFSGFRCGADVHFAWDCALTTVKHNFVFSPQKKNLTGDSAGIYFCTHWFSPGNTVSCNYVIGGDHCYYLDYCTSGVDIQGGVCLQLWDGVKLNNGKRNHIRSLLMVGLGQSPGYITCLTTPSLSHYSTAKTSPDPLFPYLSTPLHSSPPLPTPPISIPLHSFPNFSTSLHPSSLSTPLHSSAPLSKPPFLIPPTRNGHG